MRQKYLLFLTGLLSFSSLNYFSPTAVIADTKTFGDAGRSGRSGRDGQNGQNAPRRSIQITNQPQAINLIGKDGSDGSDGSDGESASFCEQPRNATYNMRGANGGIGGIGGRGGNGGRGGTVALFYQDIAQLSNFQLNNPGGQGGRGGRGGRGGQGCSPWHDSWVVDICRWELQSRSRKVPDAQWRKEYYERLACEDEDGDRNRPHRKRNRKSREYRWKFDGVIDQDRYYAYTGAPGETGRNGSNGQRGRYGSVFLIQGNRVPIEQVSYRGSIAGLMNQPMNFVKNNWLNKTGLSRYIAPGSDAPDQYRQLQTVRNKMQIIWQPKQSFKQLGNPTIQATIDPQGKLSVKLPGHLERTIRRQPGKTEVKILRGFNPDRLRKFKFQGFNQFRDAQNFSLVDEGKLIKDLRGMMLKVQVSDGQQKLKQTFATSTNQPVTPGLDILGHIYKVRLGDKFRPLLQPGKQLTYEIEVRQIARSGAVYSSKMRVKQTVDKLTLPKVEYLTGEN